MRCIHTDQLKAVHRTILTADGLKVDQRMLGRARETAIKFDPCTEVTTGLTIGEGLETTLTARQLGFRPAWSLGSAGAISDFPVLSEIEALSINEEHDKNGANRRAINSCGTRWHKAGREVIVITPKLGKDLNDTLRGRVV
jgi:putative DNA primase/helicase